VVVAVAWWIVVGSARERPFPPAPPDEGQEEPLRQAYLQALVTRRPQHWQARVNLAAVLTDSGRDQEATQQLREAARLNAADPLLWRALADSAARSNSLEDEFRGWTEVARREPRDVASRAHLAALYQRLGWHALAIRAAEEALRLDPNDPDALRIHAVVEYATEDYPAAVRDARRLIQLDPTQAVAYSIRAACYRELQDWPKALEAAEGAVRLAPGNMEYRVALARIQLDRPDGAQYQQALAALGPVSRDPDQEITRRYWEGICYQRMGDNARAVSALEWVASQKPQYEQVSYYLSRAYVRQGDTRRAAEYTRSYQQLMARRLALQEAEADLRLHLGSPDYHVKVARAALENGDAPRAVFESRFALRMEPGSAAAQSVLRQALATTKGGEGAAH
jgi:tetratricopeptide (TPR) repeat protein